MMKKEILTSARTGDSCIHVKHSSGLDIYICEMNGFSGVEALFGTKYGSVQKNRMALQQEVQRRDEMPYSAANGG